MCKTFSDFCKVYCRPCSAVVIAGFLFLKYRRELTVVDVEHVAKAMGEIDRWIGYDRWVAIDITRQVGARERKSKRGRKRVRERHEVEIQIDRQIEVRKGKRGRERKREREREERKRERENITVIKPAVTLSDYQAERKWTYWETWLFAMNKVSNCAYHQQMIFY